MSNQYTAKDLFLDALDLDPVARMAMLQERTGEDSELLERVQKLLGAHAEVEAVESQGGSYMGQFAELPVRDSFLLPVPEEMGAGEKLGPFVLIREIGQGGFGRVWLAEQEVPVRRQVALKMLKAGLDTKEITQRFRAERQALALMKHDHIAGIFDGGTTEKGLPWFAMEYVEGEPITTYCERFQLPLEARLALFLDTCRAVQHAHQKMVIHRDIKPNNVMVAEVDGRPSVKVIDFGIAKAIQQSQASDEHQTQRGQVMGTPASMSPEQLRDSADVDARSDVYALGCLLYEMLVGIHPLADSQGKLPAFQELLHAVQETEPPLASVRLREKSATSTVKHRELRSDLDWIWRAAWKKTGSGVTPRPIC